MKKDLVQILLDHYRDRIQPSLEHEVRDIAEDQGVAPLDVCYAMFIALDELDRQVEEDCVVRERKQEDSNYCQKCGGHWVIHRADGACIDEEISELELELVS